VRAYAVSFVTIRWKNTFYLCPGCEKPDVWMIGPASLRIVDMKERLVMEVRIKRAYEAPSVDDGTRVLVDAIYPRGVKKEDLRCDLWTKDVAPPSQLRRFFHKDPDGNWDEFAASYGRFLEGNPALEALAKEILEKGGERVTLVYGFRNPVRNHAVILGRELKRVLDSMP